MDKNPLATEILFWLGPIPISEAVVTTWVIMLLLTLPSWLCFRHTGPNGSGLQTVLEIVVEAIAKQVEAIVGQHNRTFVPMLGTLFLFLVFANLSAVVPGAKAPTAHVETPAALALVVFAATHYYGIRQRGLGPYLLRYVRPNPILMPLNVLSELTRTFSLMVRLFGNMMSHELVLAIMAVLAGLLVPIPFLLLGILIGLIQAYIFSVLAAVYIGAAADSVELE